MVDTTHIIIGVHYLLDFQSLNPSWGLPMSFRLHLKKNPSLLQLLLTNLLLKCQPCRDQSGLSLLLCATPQVFSSIFAINFLSQIIAFIKQICCVLELMFQISSSTNLSGYRRKENF